MAETATATPTQEGPKSIAASISQNIQDRANGKAPAAPTQASDQKPPVDPSGSQAPANPNAGKEKYVVDGKEVWLTPEQARGFVQKGMAFDKRIDEVARIKQEAIQLQNAIINDPLAVLKNISKAKNIPLANLYEKILDGDWPEEVKEIVGKRYYGKVIEPMQMTPEQRQARADAEWRQKREAEDKLNQERAATEQQQKLVQQALGHLKVQINEALKESGLPDINTPLGAEMSFMVAKLMQLADKRREPLTPKQAIEYVKTHRIQAVQSAYYESLVDKDDGGEALAKALGDRVVTAIQKHLLKKAQSNGSKPPQVPQGRVTPRGERKIVTEDEMKEYLDNIKRNNKI